ncbi:hypothetical protein LTR56_027686 [Elasticomyces elasticus]|nr:hypothetical protein LTR56_027686 [Elasticomyces elasticus]KAK3614489.1 hypothetical protein LTR22_027761 [Elasticomyces elasticus]KAK4930793.1 hypothetical protein LTR49_002557 [Elasticomyces elasticus]KAK5731875.1 hypothetical protein LTS12_027203 [Elasticomyces elasticus]
MAPRKATKAKKAAAASADAAGPKAAAAGVKKSAARKGKKAAAARPAVKRAVVATAASGRSRRGQAVPDEPVGEGSDNGDEPPPGDGGLPGGDDVPAPAPEVPAEIEEPIVEPAAALASVTDRITFQYGLLDRDDPEVVRNDEELYGKLDIYMDPAGLARLGYSASFYMNFDPDDETSRTLVGTVNAWRIEKRSDSKPNARANWVQDFLRTVPSFIEGDKTDAAWKETFMCLRAIFLDTGVPKATPHLQAELAAHSLMFIEMVYVLDDYQQRGILPAMLTLFRRLVQRLPEWFAFDGVLVLVPARPTEELGAAWGEATDKAVEKVLGRAYGRCGFRNIKVNIPVGGKDGEKVTVMDRMIEDPADAVPADMPIDD